MMSLQPLRTARLTRPKNDLLRYPPKVPAAPERREGRRTLRIWLAVGLLAGLVVGLVVLAVERARLIDGVSRLERDVATMEQKGKEQGAARAALENELAAAHDTIASLTATLQERTNALVAAQGAAQAAAKPAAPPVEAKPAAKRPAEKKPAEKPLRIMSRSVTPSSVKASADIQLVVKVKGRADKVRMQIIGTKGVAYNVVTYLAAATKAGEIETWRKTVKAPPKKGTYLYYARAFFGGKVVNMAGSADRTFEVTAPPRRAKKAAAQKRT